MYSKDALVIVDVQKGFINEHTKDIPNKILEHLKTYYYEYIVGTRYINDKDTPCYAMGGFFGCMQGTAETEIPEELARHVEHVFDKRQFSCWTQDFRTYVNSRSITKLYFCGINTDCCVMLSAIEAFERKMEFEVLTPLCGCMFGEEGHKAGITAMQNCLNPKRIIL